MQKVTVLGDGAWGTAVSTLLASNGFNVTLWCYNHDVAESINKTHYNERFLPGIKLDQAITATTDMQHALSDATIVFEAVPVKFLRSVLEQAKQSYRADQIWVLLSKGIEQKTLLLSSQLCQTILGSQIQYVVFSGPSFAHDLVRKQITAVTLASTDNERACNLQEQLANDYFRPYISHDPIGVQVGGAVKNVIALAVGMLEGAGYTDNAKAYVFSAGLQEMVSIAQVLGGDGDTVYGLSGVGDLVLTAMGRHSKNVALGKRLGQGLKLETLIQEVGILPEGINTVASIHELIIKHNLDLPVCNTMYSILFENKPIQTLFDDLMSRSFKRDCLF